jgi:predicted dehydrogenase
VVPQHVLNGVWERAAIAAGIPFLCEKPVGLNLGLARQVAREVQQRGLVTSSGYQMRQGKSAAAVRQVMARQRLAIVRACRMQKPPLVGWFRKQALTGGPMVNAGTHTVDFLRFMLGEVKTAAAIVSAGINQSSLPDGDVWDAMAAQLRFSSGAIASMDMGTVSEAATVRHELLDVYGKDFRLIWDSSAIRYKEGSADWVELPMDGDDELAVAQVRNFLDAVEQRDPSAVRGSYPDAVQTLAVTLAMNRSADEGGRPIDVNAQDWR